MSVAALSKSDDGVLAGRSRSGCPHGHDRAASGRVYTTAYSLDMEMFPLQTQAT